jgi:L-aminopeptidase/D-esterase-like protein
LTATGSITDVGGILIGHHHKLDDDAELGSGWATGSTVILTPVGTVGAVDVRGGAPGTRETDLLDPANTVQHVDAVLLTGGSAYGLAAADGVMRWLEEHRRGIVMDAGANAGENVVPIVPAAVIYDLPVGDWKHRPTAEFGYAAADNAATDPATGSAGAGVGARAGALKGGVGTASEVLGSGVTVGALVVVNSVGNVVDPGTGLPWMNYLAEELGLKAPPPAQLAALAALVQNAAPEPLNTTVAVVATDAALSAPSCRRVAVAAHDGLARAIRPSHTPLDGDAVFALATGAVEVPPSGRLPASLSAKTELTAEVGAVAADCLARAVVAGVMAADAVAGIPTYRDVLPGAFT